MSTSQLPAGTIINYVGQNLNNLPQKWLYCDGSPLAIKDYPNLHGAIGNAFGFTNDGYFNLPDLRGMFLRGVNGNALNVNGSPVDPDVDSRQPQYGGNGNAGNAVGSVQGCAMENHSHTLGSASGFQSSGDYGVCLNDGGDGGNTGVTGDSIETRPINVYVYYLIYCGD